MIGWATRWRLISIAAIAALALGCGSEARSVPPTTVSSSMPPDAATARAATPAGSPTPVPGGPTDPVEEGVWNVRLVRSDGTYPLPVTLRDATGIVTGFAAGPPDGAWVEGVDNPGGRQDLLSYTWLGGACDTITNLAFERTAAGFRLRSSTETKGGACILIGLTRQVVIGLSTPVEAGSVVVAED